MGLFLFISYLFVALWAMRLVSGMLLLLVSKNLGLRKDYTNKPSVTVLVSCYRESAAIYKTIEAASKANYPADKFEIWVFDDNSPAPDDSWEWMQKAQRDFQNVRVFRNKTNLGKGKTIMHAVEQSTSEIIVTIDSDTILHPDALTEMMACFSNPKIGLVGGTVGISNPDKNSLTMFQVYVYYVMFRLAKVPEVWLKSVACVSGCMSGIRRDVFMKIKPLIEARNWFGVPVKYGEDRFITHRVLMEGYDTYLNFKARCWTTAPDTFQDYFMQQLRWSRSGIENFFWVCWNLPENVRTVKPAALYTYFFTPLTLIYIAAIIACLPVAGFSPLVLVEHSLRYLFICAFAVWAINRFTPEQAIRKNPLRIVAYGGWWIIRTLFLIPLSVWTMDSDGWGGTRTIEEVNEKGTQ